MSTCYLLGAGASYGHDEELSHSERPPLGNSLFEAGWERDILKWKDFRPLVRKIASYNNIKKPLMEMEPSDLVMQDTEEFLSYLNQEWKAENDEFSFEKKVQEFDDKTFEYEIPEDDGTEKISEYTKEYKIPLGLAYYYIYELFRQQCFYYQPHGDCYGDMSEYLTKEFGSVISLNYDTYLEIALSAKGMNYHHFEGNRDESSIPLLKLHGSITWINKPPLTVPDAYNFPIKVQHTHGSASEAYLDGVSTQWVNHHTYRGLVYSHEDMFEPAIIPPFDKHKDYQKTRIYNQLWDYAQKTIDRASEIVIIGCSLNPSDNKLRSLLSNNVGSDTQFTIVSPSPRKIVRKLEFILGSPSIERTVGGDEPFSEYAEMCF